MGLIGKRRVSRRRLIAASALDVSAQAGILTCPERLRERLGLTMLSNTHVPRVAVARCNQVFERGSSAETAADPRNEYARPAPVLAGAA